MGAFSFYPTKNLGAAGDAGAVVTNDEETARTLRSLRLHGETSRYCHARVGGNFRMDSLQAAVLAAKLPRLREWNQRRRAIAARYGELLSGAERAGKLVTPREAAGRQHVFHQYVVRLPDRDAIREKLAAAGVATSVFYPIPLHLQECFRDLGYREGSFPVAEKAAKEVLALPIFAEMRDDEVQRVAEALLGAVA
jgi:dTDP-4-amino-4,6-dideoxygalactose transaminase